MQGTSFNHFLREKGVKSEVRSVLYHIARAIKYINFSLRAGNTAKLESENCQGEEQMALDVLADKIIANELEKSDLVCMAISEERENPLKFDCPRGEFTVAYDPLDGSSLIDANLAIGSIFGIWEGCGILGRTGADQLASCYAIYGPRVTFVIAIKDGGTHEFELNDVGEFMLVQKDFSLEKNTKYFAPGNLRASNGNPRYKALIDSWIESGRTLRYSGGMVPDLHHILSKGRGIFAYPSDEKHLHGKLRLAFECAPFSFLFAEAGGDALDQEGQKILEKKIENIHQRTPIFIGSAEDVRSAVDFLKE